MLKSGQILSHFSINYFYIHELFHIQSYLNYFSQKVYKNVPVSVKAPIINKTEQKDYRSVIMIFK